MYSFEQTTVLETVRVAVFEVYTTASSIVPCTTEQETYRSSNDLFDTHNLATQRMLLSGIRASEPRGAGDSTVTFWTSQQAEEAS